MLIHRRTKGTKKAEEEKEDLVWKYLLENLIPFHRSLFPLGPAKLWLGSEKGCLFYSRRAEILVRFRVVRLCDVSGNTYSIALQFGRKERKESRMHSRFIFTQEGIWSNGRERERVDPIWIATFWLRSFWLSKVSSLQFTYPWGMTCSTKRGISYTLTLYSYLYIVVRRQKKTCIVLAGRKQSEISLTS